MTRPLFFGPDSRPLFGWLHDAAAPARVGLVLCKPFGYEAICAHRTFAHIATAAAAAGIPALRFDLDGTGDSAGDDRDPDRPGAWVASAHAACETLRRHSGVEKVVLLGVRLGAMIATLAAETRDDVDGLIAIAPVVSGRAHVRELKLLQGLLGLPPGPPGETDPDIQEAVGFALTAETRTALGAIDLVKRERPPAPHVLILDRDDLPAAGAWAARLTELGAKVEARRVPGYVEMVLDPHKAVVPAEIVRATIEWLGARASRGTTEPGPAPAVQARISPEVVERAVVCDGGPFGILSEPATATRTGRAILLLNSGAVQHIGPNRLWTTLARGRAALGDLVLRLDLTGLGDAPPRPGEPDGVVYGPRALDDVAAAVTFLRTQPRVDRVHVVGLCSGAYHAFKAAVGGLPVDAVVVINPLTYFWSDNLSLDVPAHRVVSDVQRYKTNVLRTDSWRKVLRGEVDVRAAARSVGRHAAGLLATRARDVSRRIGFPWRDDLGAELEAIAARKVELRFVFASGDPGLPLLRAQGGSALPTLHAAGKLSISMIDGPDHTFTPLWSHGALLRVVNGALAGGAP